MSESCNWRRLDAAPPSSVGSAGQIGRRERAADRHRRMAERRSGPNKVKRGHFQDEWGNMNGYSGTTGQVRLLIQHYSCSDEVKHRLQKRIAHR
ncbi:MAG: hypothetical protein OSA39_08325, partial [Sphingobium sp.]|nr:hypothetical protein [Sphingobium sp.]